LHTIVQICTKLALVAPDVSQALSFHHAVGVNTKLLKEPAGSEDMVVGGGPLLQVVGSPLLSSDSFVAGGRRESIGNGLMPAAIAVGEKERKVEGVEQRMGIVDVPQLPIT
jgi:hypothetical protein